MIETVLFDLDGTIIDTNDLIIASFMHVFEKGPTGPLTREGIIPHMGTTLEYQLQTFSGKEDVTELVPLYRAYNQAHHDDMVKPFPYVNEVVEQLHKQGIAMGIVTTKIRPSTLMTLDKFNLAPYMDAVVTVSDVEHPKPHPEPVLTAMKLLGSRPETTLMIGDSTVDMQSAKAAGALAAGVAWSLKGEDMLRQYGADYILRDMRDVYDLLKPNQE
ncbi:pyrophosphatase PpaX [Paenibacillus lemnae]|uniref:Pyrophosphatase PpaX n=1 Tax=Paenibacillus lemnae TaxID=1330551 RepID=A0A848M7N5_PAELE|nr:pyrophosphatase PpaX [Paenibacillus lemnae]NMO97208.1 pyrophosphatase PpaX [Paenibacillus lemnae]